MATTKYIVLTNSNASLIKRFKAIAMRLPEQRTDGMDYTLGGTPDKQAGPIIRQFSYVLRIPEDAPSDDHYGNYANLQTFFGYINPNATPTDVIILTDHYGNTHNCYFVGDMSPEPLTTMLEGPNAWMIVPIQLQEI